MELSWLLSGSQSQCEVRFILPARGARHIKIKINNLTDLSVLHFAKIWPAVMHNEGVFEVCEGVFKIEWD